jgi:hypothetical protein
MTVQVISESVFKSTRNTHNRYAQYKRGGFYDDQVAKRCYAIQARDEGES